MDENNYETMEVYTAGGFELCAGIMGLVLLIILEFLAIKIFMESPSIDGKCMAILIQIPASLLFLLSLMIKYYKNRVKFTIYKCKLNTGTDIDFIKQNYCIKRIEPDYIIFVKKEDSHNFTSWAAFRDVEVAVK